MINWDQHNIFLYSILFQYFIKKNGPRTLIKQFLNPYDYYEFDRMRFGLKNTPDTFQRLMHLGLTEIEGNELLFHLDLLGIFIF